jgi:hypothetical protein
MGVWSFWAGSGQGGHVLEPTSKSWPHVQKVEGKRKNNSKRMGLDQKVQVSTHGCPPAVGWHLDLSGWPHFFESLNFFEFFFGCLGNGPRFLGEWVYNTSIFWSLPLHLEVLNLPFLMEIGDFTIFQILFFLNLEYTWTFISTVGIFVSWRIEITKNSSRFASVMDFFCTLL